MVGWIPVLAIGIALYPFISSGGVLDQLYPNWPIVFVAALGLWFLGVVVLEWWERLGRRRR
jgi:hypothetical protein